MPNVQTKPHRDNRYPLVPSDYLDRAVREIMTAGVVAVAEDASLHVVCRTMISHSVHAVLIAGRVDGRPLGWVTARGLLAWMDSDETVVPAHDAITQRAETIEPGATVREALSALSRPDCSHLLVCRHADAFPEGAVSELDLVAQLAGRAV